MSRIIFNLAAKCDRAGRSQNQDNYWVCPDLTHYDASTDKIVGTDEDVELSDKGALLVVADGMGGMNAGEVASELVIKGIKKKFSSIPDSILNNEDQIQNFIREAIVESDDSIKKYAKEHREAEGLGSTIVLLWLLNGKAFCGWCGDSRIYRFNPNNELVRLSHDHSYVQSLVDDGKITEEEAFDHPDGNIVSKALGDNGNKADPEIRVYDIYSRDVFLLCSDGLCGLLQDSEINDIIQETCTSSKDSLDALWRSGEKAGWSDNATIDLLCIVDGGKPAKGRPDGYPKIAKKPVERNDGANKPQIVRGNDGIFTRIKKSTYLYLFAIVALSIFGFAIYHVLGSNKDDGSNHEYEIETSVNEPDTPARDTGDSGTHGTNTQVGNNQGSYNSGSTNSNGGHNSHSGGQTGNNVNSGNNQNHNGQSQNNNNGNNNSQQNTNNSVINQGVINQLNSNSNSSNVGQTLQPVEVYPSNAYLNLLNTVQRDYNNAKSALSTVKTQGWRSRSTDQTIDHYMRNIDNNLRSLKNDSKNYNALNNNQKGMIDLFDQLADDIDRDYYSYPKTPSRRDHESETYGDDEVSEGGRSI